MVLRKLARDKSCRSVAWCSTRALFDCAVLLGRGWGVLRKRAHVSFWCFDLVDILSVGRDHNQETRGLKELEVRNKAMVKP